MKIATTLTMSPLTGIQILNLAYNLPGPLAARRLQDMGASVRKVEPPNGDLFAMFCPDWYAALTAGQEIQRLDLKAPASQDQLDAWLAGSDLLLTSLRPASLERLGLDWTTLHPRFPELCQVAIVGHLGSEAEIPGHDLTYQASAGLLHPPEMPRSLFSDLAGAESTASAALALLLGKARGQEAGIAMVSLAEAAVDLAAPLRYRLTRPGDLLNGGYPGYRIYSARDGGWVALAAIESQFWEGLIAALGIKEVPTEALLKEIFQTRSAHDWENWARERGLPLVEVCGYGEA